jgi:hypothetical protein
VNGTHAPATAAAAGPSNGAVAPVNGRACRNVIFPAANEANAIGSRSISSRATSIR